MRLAMERLNLTGRGSHSGQFACPRCGSPDWRGEGNSEVESTRHPDGSVTTVRRRLCQCGQHAFKTEETVVPEGFRIVVIPEESP